MSRCVLLGLALVAAAARGADARRLSQARATCADGAPTFTTAADLIDVAAEQPPNTSRCVRAAAGATCVTAYLDSVSRRRAGARRGARRGARGASCTYSVCHMVPFAARAVRAPCR